VHHVGSFVWFISMSLCNIVEFQDVKRAVLLDLFHCVLYFWGLEAICMLIAACDWHSSKYFCMVYIQQ